MKKLLLILVAFFTLSTTITYAQANNKKESVEVLSFHSKKRCATCLAIEALTAEVVKELNNPKVQLKDIDITVDKKTAEKYEVTWSSLILDKDGKKVDLTKMAFANARNNPELFKKELKKSINDLLVK